MSYSYSNPVVYGPQYNEYYETTTKKKNTFPMLVTGSVLGGGGGAFLGAKSKSYITKSGDIADSFAKNVYEKSISALKDGTKEAYETRIKILNKIDSLKTTDELKTLINENSKVSKEISESLGKNIDDFFQHVNNSNLANNKKTIKDILVVKNNSSYQDIKNQIKSCWNNDKKEFIKSSSVTDDLFNNIKKTAKNFKWKNIAKYAGIGALVTGLCGVIIAKLLNKNPV